MDWQYYHPFFRKTVTLTDGSTVTTGTLMRRRGADGSWEYRLPTDEEVWNWTEMNAW